MTHLHTDVSSAVFSKFLVQQDAANLVLISGKPGGLEMMRATFITWFIASTLNPDDQQGGGPPETANGGASYTPSPPNRRGFRGADRADHGC